MNSFKYPEQKLKTNPGQRCTCIQIPDEILRKGMLGVLREIVLEVVVEFILGTE